jgi:hypothetical protein
VGDQQAGAITTALRVALADVVAEAKDAGTIALAYLYAGQLDADPDNAAVIGPKYLVALESLLLTPRARAAAMRGVNDDQRTKLSPVDELRAKRRDRQNRAN